MTSATDITLDQGSTTLAFGSANVAYGMRPFAVFAGGGTVDTGQVGLRWTSTSVTDGGVRTAADVQVITDDITVPITDEYLTTTNKIIGAGTYELYVVSGTPTAYSVDFNYGLIKYEDFGNRDFMLTDIECTGLAGANDTSVDIEILKQSATGWTYAATGFVPGNGTIAQMTTVYGAESNLSNGEPFHFKLDKTALNVPILGSQDEGVLIRLTAGANNSFQIENAHLGVEF